MKGKDGGHRQRSVEEIWLTKLLSEFLYNVVMDWMAHPHPATPHQQSDCFKWQNQQSIQKHDTTT